MWFKTNGIIQYDPPRGKLKKKPHWWCIVNVDKEISRYYRYLFEKNTNMKLHQPSWGTHVSVIRGEKPNADMMHLWKKYDGVEIELEYSHNIRQSGDTTSYDRPTDYWFVDVKCPFLIDIRKEFGYPYNYGLHMTIGRTW